MSSRQAFMELIDGNMVCTALGWMDLGRNNLSWGGTTVASSWWWRLDGVLQRHWFPDIGKSFPDIGNSVDFPISGNHFPISENHFSISENGFNVWISGIISWYREIQFPIWEKNYIFLDIGNSNSKLFSDIGKWFSDIGNYFPVLVIQIPDIGK